jgi:predicted DNA-binding transcriptional regulator AlpA
MATFAVACRFLHGMTTNHARPFALQPPPIDLLDAHRVISQAAAAHLLGVSIDTLARMSARGEGPKRLKLSPRRVGYRLADCLGWLKSCESVPSS